MPRMAAIDSAYNLPGASYSFVRFLVFPLDKYPCRVYSQDTPRGYFDVICSKEAGFMPEPKRCSCCEEHTLRQEEQKKKLLNRLRRIEGQVRGLQAMVEADAYCNDILTQSAAVNAAVNAFNRELLAEHLRTCVARDLKDGHEEIVDELAATLQKLMK